jgi:hypothetical protein
MRSALLIAAVVAPLIGAPAAALAKDQCAAIEEPLAYNACLARRGPPAFVARPAPDPDEGFNAPRPRHGRERLEFGVGGPRR